jgi:biotin synthase
MMCPVIQTVSEAHSRKHYPIRTDWPFEDVQTLLNEPFNDLIFHAQCAHRQHFNANQVQVSALLSIKTGACHEDCGYCGQSSHHHADVTPERLLDLDTVLTAAQAAKAQGATRFCMGAAWRGPTDRHLETVETMIRAVHELGLETCVTLGMLTLTQAQRLKAAGLDYYNHNLDTSPEFYGQVITTRTYQDRLETLAHLRAVGLKICSGGIIGMGESRTDRASLLHQLATLPQHPESVPMNLLVRVAGTPLATAPELDLLEFVRTIAAARILMPASHIRLSAGRSTMSDEMQTLCYLAGANSIFYGDRLLTTANASVVRDLALFERLGVSFEFIEPSDRDYPGSCTHAQDAAN